MLGVTIPSFFDLCFIAIPALVVMLASAIVSHRGHQKEFLVKLQLELVALFTQ